MNWYCPRLQEWGYECVCCKFRGWQLDLCKQTASYQDKRMIQFQGLNSVGKPHMDACLPMSICVYVCIDKLFTAYIIHTCKCMFVDWPCAYPEDHVHLSVLAFQISSMLLIKDNPVTALSSRGKFPLLFLHRSPALIFCPHCSVMWLWHYGVTQPWE
jgi:hypothetical protein